MPDDSIADFCTNCGAQNSAKKRFCSECGALLIKKDNSQAGSLPQKITSMGDQEKIRKNNTLIVGGAIFVLLLIVVIYASGTVAIIAPQSIVGKYRLDNDIGIADIEVRSDGTYSQSMVLRGTWEIEGNKLKVTRTRTEYSSELENPKCNQYMYICTRKTYQVPTDEIEYYNIGWNTLEKDGGVWHKVKK
jgi:hypothetical protein